MSIKNLLSSNFKQLLDIFQNHQEARGNITNSAKQFCKQFKYPYSDNVRREASRLLKKNTHKASTHTAKVLVYDIETSPLISYHWGLWQQNISYEDVIQDWKILCFSAKWLFNEEIISDKMTKEELKTFDDKRLVQNLWKLLDEADVVIAHNGKKFDNKKSAAKFFEYGLNPPSSYQVIDTLEHAKRKFALTSNKLDAIGQRFGLGRKVETPKGMWREVMNQNYDMLIEMSKYCDGDNLLLEEVYLAMRPFIQPHPNLNLFIGDNISACPSCGDSEHLVTEKKPYTTTVAQYDLHRCTSCGSLSRSRKISPILSSVPQ